MLKAILIWMGFAPYPMLAGQHGHSHDHDESDHGHTHGVIDPTIASTTKGIWAIKWSFIILSLTAIAQIAVVYLTNSVGLLADTIHNFGDAATAIPLWIAFLFARRASSRRFNYGYYRVEDLAGIVIVGIILFSAIYAGYESIHRFFNPQPIEHLGPLAVAGLLGFLGNEAVAVFRVRVGRQINSAALIADGYHARVDGITSLAVVAGALGVWLGFPLADPIVGLVITFMIFGIVWQSARAVFTRILDGVEPGVLDEIEHAAEHVPGINKVINAKARWLGHKLRADVTIAVNDNLSLGEAKGISSALERELFAHLPALAVANVRFGSSHAPVTGRRPAGPGHHHAPEPFRVQSRLATGLLEIVDTPQGERMRLTVSQQAEGLQAVVTIDRDGRAETLPLSAVPSAPDVFESSVAPDEPHEFEAQLRLVAFAQTEVLPFRMTEPAGHHH